MKESKTTDYGIVYVLTNDCMPGLVKIGKTSRLDLDKRMRELFSTGVPLPFKCVHACRVKLSHMDELERALHCAFTPNRVNENREFFRISPDQVKPILKLFGHMTEGDVTAEVETEIEKDLTDDDKAAIVKSKSRRPPLNFEEMGIMPGDTLTFIKDPSVLVSVVSAKKVLYEGEQFSLSPLTTKLLGRSTLVQPTPYWEFKGENLLDIYDRVYPLVDE